MPVQVNRSARPRRTSVSRAAAMAAACVFLAGAGAAQAAVPPQVILFHGRILTVNAQDSIVEALAIRDGKIIALGTDQEVLRLADSTTKRIDLHGRTATPGLIDSHAHIAEGGVDELYHVHLSDASTVAEVVRRVQAGIAALKPGDWLQGDGWDEGKLAERRYVTAADLDAVSRAQSGVADSYDRPLRRRQFDGTAPGKHFRCHPESARRHDRP